MSPLPRLNIAHTYQEGGIKFHEPHAAQIHIYHTMHGLQAAGHRVSLLALQGRRVLFTDDLRVFKNNELTASHYGRTGWSETTAFQRFESGVRRLQTVTRFPYLALFDSFRMAEAGYINLKGYDLIHERFNLLALGGAWASRKLGIPFVLEVNADLLEQRKFKGVPEKGLRRMFAVWATQACFSAASKIICISKGLQDHLHSKWKIEASKLTALPCAADVDAFQADHDSERVRQSLGLTNEPVLMWIGGFFPWHDLDLLLESFTRVLPSHPGARLVLVGDGQTRQSIAQKARESGIEKSVMMTGAIAHSRIPEMLSIADVTLVPSAPVRANHGGTGTPLKLFEYMAAGKAIVATAHTQTAEVIRNGYSGLLVQEGDVDRFAGSILTLLNNPAERARLGQNARRQANELYSWEHYNRRLEEIYFDVLANVPSGSRHLSSTGMVRD